MIQRETWNIIATRCLVRRSRANSLTPPAGSQPARVFTPPIIYRAISNQKLVLPARLLPFSHSFPNLQTIFPTAAYSAGTFNFWLRGTPVSHVFLFCHMRFPTNSWLLFLNPSIPTGPPRRPHLLTTIGKPPAMTWNSCPGLTPLGTVTVYGIESFCVRPPAPGIEYAPGFCSA